MGKGTFKRLEGRRCAFIGGKEQRIRPEVKEVSWGSGVVPKEKAKGSSKKRKVNRHVATNKSSRFIPVRFSLW
jgi:hypothetical protein